MIKKLFIIVCYLPLCFYAQEEKQEDCKDENRLPDQLPCTITYRYGSDTIPDEEAVTGYVDILIKRLLLNPIKVKPYFITSIVEDKVWHVEINSYKCLRCKIYININKNTGEVLNFYKVDVNF